MTGMLTQDECSMCGVDLRGQEIPLKDRIHYRPDITHYSRVIGIKYHYSHSQHDDGISEWMCPDCGFREGRWTGKILVGSECEMRKGAHDNGLEPRHLRPDVPG